jgi:hypothetical protein
MPSILTADSKIVRKSGRRDEEVYVANLLPSQTEPGILLTPDPGHGIVDTDDRQPVRLTIAHGLHELKISAEVFDQPGAIKKVRHVTPLKSNAWAADALGACAILKESIHIHDARPAAGRFLKRVWLGGARKVKNRQGNLLPNFQLCRL